MPLTTYTAGEVLTASSLNANFTAAGGLQFIKSQTIGTAVSSVTVTDAFSSAYDTYKITVTGGTSSTTAAMWFKLGASVTGYNNQLVYGSFNNTPAAEGAATVAQFNYGGLADTNGLSVNMELTNPFLAKYTYIQALNASISIAGMGMCTHKVATSYTSFILSTSTGTMTGGTIRVYGYANS
jgi:ribosomal protein S6E (S10)